MARIRKVSSSIPTLATTLKYCGVFPPWGNCWNAETWKHARSNRSTTVCCLLLGNTSAVPTQRRGKHISAAVSRHATTAAAWDVFCAVSANQEYNWVFCAVGAEAMYGKATLGIFADSSVGVLGQFSTSQSPICDSSVHAGSQQGVHSEEPEDKLLVYVL
jgi:hypothetical protein